jgi:hypothetical protein
MPPRRLPMKGSLNKACTRTTRNIADGTFMTCKDCGHTISMNKMCETPLQSAKDTVKHMATQAGAMSLVIK